MIKKIWHRLFLEERPSISLSFFRIAVALTTGFHVLPSFFQLSENYYSTAFKTYNLSFFPLSIVELVRRSPDGLVLFFVFFFLVVWLFFLIGLFTQLSCILMILACYYFYALNCYHIGTLSWDILLVTVFLMCLTPYPGDYFSVDCLRRADPFAYQRRRPFFLQRLLQMQIAFTYFYTALYKISARGNWLTDNPIYYLMNYPPMGVTKNFLLREFFAAHPQLCYWTGILIIACELLMPFLLFYRKTRNSAIVLGIFFHIVLILTFDVPAIFFFLFPAQLLLFINPEGILRAIERRRERSAQSVQSILLYDGNCQFCRRSVAQLRVMDLFNTLKMVDYNTAGGQNQPLPGNLTSDQAASQLHLIEPEGVVFGGYFVFRRLSLKLPMLYPLIPVFYFPGAGVVGPLVYRWVAKNRYLFHFNKTCRDNRCFMRVGSGLFVLCVLNSFSLVHTSLADFQNPPSAEKKVYSKERQKLQENELKKLERQKRQDDRVKRQEEKKRITRLKLQARAIYAEARKLYKIRNFTAAKQKFEEVDQILPNYRSTGDYLVRIDNNVEKEKQRQTRRAKQKFARELNVRAKAIYHEAVGLYRRHDLIAAQEKFIELEGVQSGYGSTRDYLQRIDQELNRPKEQSVQEKNPGKKIEKSQPSSLK